MPASRLVHGRANAANALAEDRALAHRRAHDPAADVPFCAAWRDRATCLKLPAELAARGSLAPGRRTKIHDPGVSPVPRAARQWAIASAGVAAAGLCLFSAGAEGGPDSVQRGNEFARVNCARCHSIERTGESTLKAAPPFRTLHKRYPVEYLEEALAEGIVTGHPDMPEFRLEPDQIADFIDFLKSFEE